MSLVGLTQRVVIDPNHGERRDALDQRWPLFLAAAGLGAVALPNEASLAVKLADKTGVSGIILTGGGDLADYGGDAPERDAAEVALLAWAHARKIPVMGVCRGMQAIQHKFGVRLHRIEGHVTASHPAVVEGARRDVNSFHNFATRETAPELEIWAHALDDSVEAIRHRTEKVSGIMWHPERCAPFDENDLKLFASFLGAST